MIKYFIKAFGFIGRSGKRIVYLSGRDDLSIVVSHGELREQRRGMYFVVPREKGVKAEDPKWPWHIGRL